MHIFANVKLLLGETRSRY